MHASAQGQRRGTLLGASALAVAFMTGCAAQAAEASAPWSAQIAEAYEQFESDFIREVLSDGVIDTAEAREARDRYLSCMQDAGIPVALWEDGDHWGTSMPRELTEAEEGIEFQCWLDWDGPISGLYTNITQNPEAVDRDELIAACLIRHGLAPDGFRGRDFRELVAPTVASFTGTETEAERQAIEDVAASAPQPVLPGGQLLNDGIAWDCQVNPQL